ncbi:MAG: hypothetical protein ABNH38_04425 [Tateyamaria sp.]|uniref:hypothetical protein n=1 Tax=Tateyamaria sp. TaxID=1929288 RepID=UPI0032DCC747
MAELALAKSPAGLWIAPPVYGFRLNEDHADLVIVKFIHAKFAHLVDMDTLPDFLPNKTLTTLLVRQGNVANITRGGE